MITVHFPIEWAIRSSILITGGMLLVWVLRVKDPAKRLAAWTALLFASVAIPALTATLPRAPMTVTRVAPPSTGSGIITTPTNQTPGSYVAVTARGRQRFNWAAAAGIVYCIGLFALLLRLGVGLAISLRVLGRTRETDRNINGISIRESDRINAPVTLGILRPVIVLPADWRESEHSKLDAALAHERSHIRRYDPLLQLLSAIHRALLWPTPLSWFLHRCIVQTAEEASDDAALTVVKDRAVYAEVLLGFTQRGVRSVGWSVPMARYGRADKRIQRILDATYLPTGITRGSLAAIFVVGSPLLYLAAAAYPQTTPSPPAAPTTKAAPAPLFRPPGRSSGSQVPQPMAAQTARSVPVYLPGLGTVTPSSTVVIRPRVDGQLLSVAFKEGDTVQAGQLLATIDPRPYEIQLAQAQSQFALNKDQAAIDRAQLQLSYTQIRAPGPGAAGLLQVDPGNFVHAGDSIVVITQVQPIAVIFSVPEDTLPLVLARQREKTTVPVEAWNRDNSKRLATGQLVAVDNLIDSASGTAKLKAVFENKDGALYPNQFVNARMLLRAR